MVNISGNSAISQTLPSVLQQGGSNSSSLLNTELTEEEEKVVQDLKERDQEVRTHENAHKSAGGGYVGAISYETTTGPDGREYAIGGEAQIDSSPISGNPEATIRKMDIIIRAALAPAEPSSQDFAVARAAQAARLQAQQELREQERLERVEEREDNQSPTNLALLNEENNDASPSFKSASNNLIQASNVAENNTTQIFSA